jgi:hypothetical protein
MVWRQVSLREGFGPPATDWKHHYVTCVQLLQHLKKGRAFQHRSFAPKCFRCSDVRDVAFWNGCILAGEIIELHPFYFSSPSSFSVPLSLPVRLFNLFRLEVQSNNRRQFVIIYVCHLIICLYISLTP